MAKVKNCYKNIVKDKVKHIYFSDFFRPKQEEKKNIIQCYSDFFLDINSRYIF